MEVKKSKDEGSPKSKQGKKVIKRGTKLTTRGKKKTKSPSIKTADTGTPPVLPSPVDTIIFDDELVIENRGMERLEGFTWFWGYCG